MTGGKKPKKRWRRLVGIAFSLFSLAVLTYIAVMLISGRGLDFSWFTGIFSSREPVEMAEEYHFDVGRDRAFAELDGSVVAVGSLGVQVLDPGGNETLRDPFRMSNPAVKSVGGRAIAFDIGGAAVRVFSGSQVLSSVEANGVIVSASINQNGWFSVSTQESGYRGVVTVFDYSGRDIFRVFMATGYVLSAEISPDNRSLAILNLTDDGSRITFYHGLNREAPDNAYVLPGKLILDIRYLPNGDLLAVSTESLIVVDRNGAGTEMYDFSGGRLGGYIIDGDFLTLHLLDYGVGHRGRLVTLGVDGAPLAERGTQREIISMSSRGGYLTILRNDGLFFFDAELKEIPSYGEEASTAGASRVITLGDGTALAAGDHSAIVIKVGEGDARH